MSVRPSTVPDHERQPVLTDEVLLDICRVGEDAPEATSEWRARLQCVPALMDEPCARRGHRLELALALLAAVLGRLKQYNPAHLPFGYSGPTIRSHNWVERDALERVGKQIAGLMWPALSAETVAAAIERAVSESVRLGFLEQQQYDAWRPGMPSGSGWRKAVAATPYGILKAEDALRRSGLAFEAQAGTESRACSSQPVGAGRPSPEDKVAASSQDNSTVWLRDDRYEWARQVELVRAVNQVLGPGYLDKGVLSRACRGGEIETNGCTGRATRVQVRSFLQWAGSKFAIAKPEVDQVRNAIIGEITERNS